MYDNGSTKGSIEEWEVHSPKIFTLYTKQYNIL